MTTTASSTAPSKGLNIGLWIVQVLLAALFLFAGGIKLITPISEFAKQPGSDWMVAMPWLVRFIGVSEVAGALGMLLPAATRIKPVLTAWAGVGLTVVMVLALGFHVMRGEFSHGLPVIVIGAMAAFVAWGRFGKAALSPRS